MFVHSSADINLHIPANAAWFAVCAAVATSSRNRKYGVGSRQQDRRQAEARPRIFTFAF